MDYGLRARAVTLRYNGYLAKINPFAKTYLWGNSGPGGFYNAGTYTLNIKNKAIILNYSAYINLTDKKVTFSDGVETFSIVKESVRNFMNSSVEALMDIRLRHTGYV